MPPITGKFPKAIPHNPQVLYTPENLLKWGVQRADAFCDANKIRRMMTIEYPPESWKFDTVCAYWRKDVCHICLEHCARPARGETDRRNWNWPGSVTDRTPYGVVCHELGHHCDMGRSVHKGDYYGEYSDSIRRRSGEKPITSYCPNDAEWFAEMFRLFVTNHALLSMIRPKTWDLLTDDWTPVSDNDYVNAFGPGCPARILAAQLKR